MPVDFDKQSYWHERFASETQFEWLVPSHDFMAILKPYLERLDPSSAQILNLGCGTSDLQNHLRHHGFLNITNVDYEPLAVERGRQLEERAFGDVKMSYAVADVTQLNHSPAGGLREERGRGNLKFDLVVDKSTVDAVSCGGETSFLRMARCVRDRLADGAFWISLSYSSERFNVDGLPFQVKVIAKVPTPKLKATDPDVYHWCYLMQPA